jgi:hypothetical protein
MTRRECRRLVKEEQLGVPPGLHQLPPAVLELEATEDPTLAAVEPANRTVLIVEAAAIAHQGPAGGIGHEYTPRGYAVLPRARGHH